MPCKCDRIALRADITNGRNSNRRLRLKAIRGLVDNPCRLDAFSPTSKAYRIEIESSFTVSVFT